MPSVIKDSAGEYFCDACVTQSVISNIKIDLLTTEDIIPVRIASGYEMSVGSLRRVLSSDSYEMIMQELESNGNNLNCQIHECESCSCSFTMYSDELKSIGKVPNCQK